MLHMLFDKQIFSKEEQKQIIAVLSTYRVQLLRKPLI